MSARAHVHGFPVGPFQSNTYVVSEGGRALVVDPGDEAGKAAAYVAAHQLEVKAILLTHGHLDHVGGAAELEKLWDVDSYLHPADRFLVQSLAEKCALFGVPALPEPQRLRDMQPGDVFRAGAVELRVAAAPGHSPGHVILVGPGFALVGDVIFAGSVGRTDFPGGDGPTLLRSIQEQILSLPEETVLYPGHGPATTVAAERRGNPFLAPGALG